MRGISLSFFCDLEIEGFTLILLGTVEKGIYLIKGWASRMHENVTVIERE